nr:hypothetical protein [Candidatus Sigynarchaeota archaeon]
MVDNKGDTKPGNAINWEKDNLPGLDLTGVSAIEFLKWFVSNEPMPKVGTILAKKCASSIALHLTMLFISASDANLQGRHSCSLFLLRGMEDALDCFSAVSLVPGCAEKWTQGKLKASDAAKACEGIFSGEFRSVDNKDFSSYRKGVRDFLNNYTHCTPVLTDWNCYMHFDPLDLDTTQKDGIKLTMRLNYQMRLLESNGRRISGYLQAHMLEFLEVIRRAFTGFLKNYPIQRKIFRKIIISFETIMKKYYREGVVFSPIPPEVSNPILRDPRDPTKIIMLDMKDIGNSDREKV